jgi:hypothetical protein
MSKHAREQLDMFMAEGEAIRRRLSKPKGPFQMTSKQLVALGTKKARRELKRRGRNARGKKVR